MRKDGLIAAVIGKDGRTTAIEQCLRASPRISTEPILLSSWKKQAEPKRTALERAREAKPDFVVVGPEEPLADGVVDELRGLGIPCIGPTRSLARIESSKVFARELLSKYQIAGNPEYKVFRTNHGIASYVQGLGEYVVKPDGLTGGKGVRISGSHLFTTQDCLDYCAELLHGGSSAVVIEEKLDGEEFSLQAFCDGSTVVDMVVVQDHKRAFNGDAGPNTGGMGSYSCEDHSLPFLRPSHLEAAKAINSAVAHALFAETGEKYKGILYGGFMATKNGVRLLEYNARFGDPEALNVLSLLKTDFVDICEAIIDGTLNQLEICFENRATVCKYLVPEGYPEKPIVGGRIDLSRVPDESHNLKIFRAAVEEKEDGVFLSESRAIAFVGLGKDLDEAERIAENAASSVIGPVFHRSDIGTRELVEKRVTHMRNLEDGRANRTDLGVHPG